MGNIIVIVVLIILIFVGIRESRKHLNGESSCCGGGDTMVRLKPNKLSRVVKKRTVIIDGMTCENCKTRVQNSLNELDGISAVVNLKKKTAIVSLENDESDDRIIQAITEAGYDIVSIS